MGKFSALLGVGYAFFMIFQGIVACSRRNWIVLLTSICATFLFLCATFLFYCLLWITGIKWAAILRGISSTVFVFALIPPFSKKNIVRGVLILVFLGYLSNCLVGAINGGIPVTSEDPEIVESVRKSPFYFLVSEKQTSLAILGDWIELDGYGVISPGDLIVSLGGWVFLCNFLYQVLKKLKKIIPKELNLKSYILPLFFLNGFP